MIYDKIFKNGKDKKISDSYERYTFWKFAPLPFVYCTDQFNVSSNVIPRYLNELTRLILMNSVVIS